MQTAREGVKVGEAGGDALGLTARRASPTIGPWARSRPGEGSSGKEIAAFFDGLGPASPGLVMLSQ
ncbi:hypothetical protein GXW83_32355 [Streptacidiphilus sp. PB12-B1b]|uniref:hypothetical protein n=1 Tax=Streptacidiphilus sp. PB12-B1b TaxID=2705012 RepID=UPI0015FA9CEB|nr:hypothetical protein [Streptacidiphilus sp. PB12-B1b]QMU79702.1 hypothetical protein GXW83_32355 [Streptacidiphilus sp. PB12-B1b]